MVQKYKRGLFMPRRKQLGGIGVFGTRPLFGVRGFGVMLIKHFHS